VKLLAGFLLAVVLSGVAHADLSKAKLEQNLEKRSRLALENAQNVLKDARKAYDAGNLTQSQALLVEIMESVELAFASLEETGKNPRRKPKHFKHAEKETRNLLKRIEAFEYEMSVDDRAIIQKLKKRTGEINEKLLVAILGGKR
jgi:regulator of PEP synthase PpsR (kinase-PPPase family)